MSHKAASNGVLVHSLRPLHETRGNNPPRLVGFKCKECSALFTENGTPSKEDRIIETNKSWQGRVVPNKSHQRRLKAK